MKRTKSTQKSDKTELASDSEPAEETIPAVEKEPETDRDIDDIPFNDKVNPHGSDEDETTGTIDISQETKDEINDPSTEEDKGEDITATTKQTPEDDDTKTQEKDAKGIESAKEIEEAQELMGPKQQRVIQIQDLSLTFDTNDGPVHALANIDLDVEAGDFISFIGPSGCGKTTLLRVIADLEQPTSGDIMVNGVPPKQARLNRAYGYVFQAAALYPWRSIARNVALPLEIMGLSRGEQKARVAKNLKLVGLEGFENKFPWQLSGGMQQRASIARALAVEPDLLLMDEPFGALDEIVRDHLNEQLLQLWDETNKTIVFVTHSIPEAVFLSRKIVVMSPRPGRVYEVIDCDLPYPRNLDIRETPEFTAIAQQVRAGLRAGHSYDE